MYPVKRITSYSPLLCPFLRLFALRRIKHHTNDIPSLVEYSYKVWLQQYLARLIIKEILIKEVYDLVFLHAFQYLQHMPVSIWNRFVHHPITQPINVLQQSVHSKGRQQPILHIVFLQPFTVNKAIPVPITNIRRNLNIESFLYSTQTISK